MSWWPFCSRQQAVEARLALGGALVRIRELEAQLSEQQETISTQFDLLDLYAKSAAEGESPPTVVQIGPEDDLEQTLALLNAENGTTH